MDLVRKQTYITPEQDRAIKRVAAEQGRTEADIVREALSDWLRGRAAHGGADPFESMIGLFDGPVVSNHDDIYR